MNLHLWLTLNCLQRVLAAQSHRGPPHPHQYASGSHCSIPWWTRSLSQPRLRFSASSPHTGHHLPRQTSPQYVCVCVCVCVRQTKTEVITEKRGLVGSKRGYCELEKGRERGLLLSSSSPFLPACRTYIFQKNKETNKKNHKKRECKTFKLLEDELKIKVTRSFCRVAA